MRAGYRGDSFIQGAIILSVAQLITKLLGALYRIPLYRLIGDEGMGLVQMAYPLYTTLLAISTIGIPVAISKMVAENLALRDRNGAYRVFKVSMAILALSGLGFSLFLFFGAQRFALVINQDPRSSLAIAAIAPAIFFVAVISAFRGFFQGYQQMVPTAVSQVIEQFVRVGTMFVLAYLLLPKGLEYAAAGATFGAVTGAVVGLIYLVVLFIRQRETLLASQQKAWRIPESVSMTVNRIISLSVPISLAGLVLPLILLIDQFLVPRQLQSIGIGVEEATGLYGRLSGGAMPLINLPSAFTAALATSLVPAISEAGALGDTRQIQRKTGSAIRLTMILVLPSAAGLYLLASEVSTLLYGVAEVGMPLRPLSFLVIFLGLQQTTSAVLQALGLTMVPVKNLVIGAILKLVLTLYLTPIWSIQGAAIASVLAFVLASFLNLLSIKLEVGQTAKVKEALVKPLISTLVMGLVVRMAYVQVFQATASNTWGTLGAIVLGFFVYAVVMIVIGGITAQDLVLIPKIGPILARIVGGYSKER